MPQYYHSPKFPQNLYEIRHNGEILRCVQNDRKKAREESGRKGNNPSWKR